MSKKERKEKPYRGVNDEIRREHQKTKDMTLKGKLSYFWDYYKVHTAAAIVILIIAVSLIYDVVTQKDFIFYNVMLNNTYLSGDLLETSFGEYAGLDMENYETQYIHALTSFTCEHFGVIYRRWSNDKR